MAIEVAGQRMALQGSLIRFQTDLKDKNNMHKEGVTPLFVCLSILDLFRTVQFDQSLTIAYLTFTGQAGEIPGMFLAVAIPRKADFAPFAFGVDPRSAISVRLSILPTRVHIFD